MTKPMQAPIDEAVELLQTKFGYTATDAGRIFLQESLDNDASTLVAAGGTAVAIVAFQLQQAMDAIHACQKNMHWLIQSGGTDEVLGEVFLHNLDMFRDLENVRAFVETFTNNSPTAALPLAMV